MKLEGVDVVIFPDAAAFVAWLKEHHSRQQGVWIKIAKKDSGQRSLTADEAVDVGLCWGWISGQRRALDETHYLQKYVPRRPGSLWSQVNVEKAESLIKSRRMRAPGLAEIAAAKADGRWKAAYAPQSIAAAPADLLEALLANKKAGKAYARLNKTAKYNLILPLLRERTPERRASRLGKLIDELQAST